MTAELFRRNLERLGAPSADKLQLLESLLRLEAFHADTQRVLDKCERGGYAGVSRLCWRVASSPLCAFTQVQRWGVCALMGRTVNRMLLVTEPDTGKELAIDDKFAPFLMGLWSLSHLELIETSRGEVGEEEQPLQVAVAELAASYVASLLEVRATLGQTAAAIAIH